MQAVIGGSGEITISGQVVNPNLSAHQPATLSVSVDGQPPVSEVLAGPRATTTSAAAGTQVTGYNVVVAAPAGDDDVTVTYVGSDGAPSVVQGTWPVTVAETAAQRRDAELKEIIPSTGGFLAIVGTALTLLFRRRARRSTR